MNIIKSIFLSLILCFSFGFSQDDESVNSILDGIFPKSFNYESKMNVYSYDGKEHRSVNHYFKLYEIMLNELNIKGDTAVIHLVFINDSWYNTINHLNPDIASIGNWGALTFNNTTLIFILNSMESDGTFFHELTHVLHNARKIRVNLNEIEMEIVARFNSKMMLGSKSYLEYINELSIKGFK